MIYITYKVGTYNHINCKLFISFFLKTMNKNVIPKKRNLKRLLFCKATHRQVKQFVQNHTTN